MLYFIAQYFYPLVFIEKAILFRFPYYFHVKSLSTEAPIDTATALIGI